MIKNQIVNKIFKLFYYEPILLMFQELYFSRFVKLFSPDDSISSEELSKTNK